MGIIFSCGGVEFPYRPGFSDARKLTHIKSFESTPQSKAVCSAPPCSFQPRATWKVSMGLCSLRDTRVKCPRYAISVRVFWRSRQGVI